ncbi:MAG: hypothetical protein R3D59_10975 [Paracoccaceae bacterium]
MVARQELPRHARRHRGRKGEIASLDDPATAYARRLVGSAWDGVTIRDLLHMARVSPLTSTETTGPT